MRRGELWWADLGNPFGSEPGLRRPVLVVQSDPFNQSSLQTVVVVPLTSNLKRAAAPGNVRCRGGDTGLPKASVANVSQIAAIDRRRLHQKVGQMPERLVQRVESGIRLLLSL